MERVWGSQIVICIGTALAGAFGITASIFVLCFSWLVPSVRNAAPPRKTVNSGRRPYSRAHKKSKSLHEAAVRVPSPPRPEPTRHVSFHEPPLLPPRVARPAGRSPSPRMPTCRCKRSSCQHKATPPPSPRGLKVSPRPQSSPQPGTSALSSDETLVEKSSPDSSESSAATTPDQANSESDISPRLARKGLFSSSWRGSKRLSTPPADILMPVQSAPPSPAFLDPTRRPLDQSTSDVSTLGTHLAASIEADELGVRGVSAIQVESARERGRFAWRLSRSRGGKSKSPREALLARSATVDSSSRPTPRLLQHTPTHSPILLASSLAPLAESSAQHESDSELSRSSQRHRRSASLSSGRKRFLAPLSPELQLCTLPNAASCKSAKQLRRASTPAAPREKPARTQPYAGPYNVPPPDVGEWGVLAETA